MTIDQNGFLDPDAASWITKHRGDLRELFAVSEEINRLAQTSLYKLQIHSEEVQELLVSLFFVRALAAHQTSILLIERGLAAEARIILRNQLEILFKLRAVSIDRDVAVAYVHEDEVFRKRFINKFKALSPDVQKAQGNPRLDELLAEIKKNIEEKDIQERQTQWYAHKAGLMDFYNTAYSLFSGTVHANVRDLEALLETDQNGKVTGIQYGPDIARDLDKLLLTGGEAQCLIMEDVNRTFGLNLGETIAKLHQRLKDAILARDEQATRSGWVDSSSGAAQTVFLREPPDSPL